MATRLALAIALGVLVLCGRAGSPIDCDCEVCKDVFRRILKTYQATTLNGTAAISLFESMDLVQDTCASYTDATKHMTRRKQLCHAIGANQDSMEAYGLRSVAHIMSMNVNQETALCESIRDRVTQDVCAICFPKNPEELA
ncbi:hypothetical protein AAMO2058_000228200 [Amorphochlora amoebiformis]